MFACIVLVYTTLVACKRRSQSEIGEHRDDMMEILPMCFQIRCVSLTIFILHIWVTRSNFRNHWSLEWNL